MVRVNTFNFPRAKFFKVVLCSVVCYFLYYLLTASKLSSWNRPPDAFFHDDLSRRVRGELAVHTVTKGQDTAESGNSNRGVQSSGDRRSQAGGQSVDNGAPGNHAKDAAGQGSIQSQNVTQMPWCPLEPIVKDPNYSLRLENITHEALVAEVGNMVRHGGHFLPDDCLSRENLAVIIPYRDRERNLHILLRNLLPFLERQRIEFTVFLVEQTADYPFNKGLLFNAAYRESQKVGNFTCFVMQDVDLIPMDNRNLYRCADNPRHLCLSTGQTEWMKKLPYPLSFGGAIALRKAHMERVNGFSISYYGWGLEDDDLALRVIGRRLRLTRYSMPIGRYYRLDHKKEKPNTRWNTLRKSIRLRQKTDGLSTLNYTLVRHEKRPLYTWLLIQVPPPPHSIYGVKET